MLWAIFSVGADTLFSKHDVYPLQKRMVLNLQKVALFTLGAVVDRRVHCLEKERKRAYKNGDVIIDVPVFGSLPQLAH